MAAKNLISNFVNVFLIESHFVLLCMVDIESNGIEVHLYGVMKAKIWNPRCIKNTTLFIYTTGGINYGGHQEKEFG